MGRARERRLYRGAPLMAASPRRPLPSLALVHYTSPPVIGGVETVIGRHARLLAEQRFEVHLVSGRGSAPGHGVRFHRLPLLDTRHRRVLEVTRALEQGRVPPAYAALTARIGEAVGRALRGVDLCLVHNVLTLHKNLALTAALHRLAAERPDLGLVAWCHDLTWTNPQYRDALHAGPPWDLLVTPIRGAAYVAVSYERRQQLSAALRLPAAQIEVIPDGIDPEAFFHLTPAVRWLADVLRLWTRQMVLLLPVRITRRKQIEYAIRVAAELARRELSVRLLVTGPPGAHNPHNEEYLEELRALRHALGVDEQVVFCRDLPGPDGRGFALSERAMADLYAVSDAVLLPSREEGFGLPLLEAGLGRVPVFASAIEPFGEIGGDAIHTFDLQDPPAACAQRIVHGLMDDRAYRLRRRIVATYAWDAILRTRILPLLTRLVAAPHR